MISFCTTIILGTFCQTPKSTSIDFAYWKWVVLVGVAAVVIFYLLKRVADVFVERKTNKLIRESEEEEHRSAKKTEGSD